MKIIVSKMTMALIVALSSMTAFDAFAEDELGPRQIEQIRQMFREESARIKSEIVAEMEKKANEPKPLPPGCAVGVPAGECFPGEESDQEVPAGTRSLTPGEKGAGENREVVRPLVNGMGAGAEFAPIGRSFSSAGSGRSEVQYDLNFDEDKAVAGIAYTRSRSSINDANLGVARSWTVGLTAPIAGDKKDYATFASLDGFGAGVELNVGSAWIFTDLGFVEELSRNEDFARLCRAAGLRVSGCTYQAIKAKYEERGDGRSAIRKFMRAYYKPAWGLGVGMKIANDEFSFFDTGLNERSSRQTRWGLNASVVRINRSREHLQSLGLEYQNGYESADVSILCPVDTAATYVACVEGPFGAPTRADKKLLWFEARGAWSFVGYSLKLTHDFESDRSAVDLPVYVIRSQEGRLMGGIRLGWQTDRDFGVGIFISSPLSLDK